MADTMRPLLIAAPSSGCGKTTVALGLLAALRRRGLVVAPFKVGPDFIDPGHHAAACGRLSRNLDGWMCSESWVRESFARGSAGADLALIEGVMGLFDGAAGGSDTGSSAEIARWLGARVLLVIDARAQARSAAALVQGFVSFEPRLEFAGVLCNRVGSDNHRDLLTEALASVPALPPLLGCLPRTEELALPERHLGLVTAADCGRDDEFFARLADWIERHVDLDRLLESRGQVSTPDTRVQRGDLTPRICRALSPRVRIGVARDAAFCFYYPENLELLAAAGAELIEFSPLSDGRLPAGLDGLYLGGGYPELHAAQLADNRPLLDELKQAAAAGLPIYAECGGLMLLAEAIDGRGMTGIFPGAARLLPRRKALGYREVTLRAATLLGPPGTMVRGQEFHYSEFDPGGAVDRVYRVSRRDGTALADEGFRRGNVLGSYVHLHFGSNPQVAEHLVAFCRQNRP